MLAADGYEPEYGARPLKRLIRKRLLGPLSTAVLDGRLPDETSVMADYKDGQLRLTPV
jgi:ATP-dependent Clp protease ATP-binding subunit ClpA